MGLYQYVREAWKKPENSGLWKERLIKWRQETATLRLEHPTRIDRARSLGFKAKQGFLVVRQRVPRGGRMRPNPRHPRRSKAMSRRRDLAMSYQVVAEQRVANKFVNCEVLNSYYVAEDGLHLWYEIILVDRTHPVIMADPRISWISSHKGRVYRGLTSSARKGRGFRHKGKGTEKFRPSRKARGI